MSKSKCTKHTIPRPLWKVQLWFRVAGARDSAPCQKRANREGFVMFCSISYTSTTLQLYFNYTSATTKATTTTTTTTTTSTTTTTTTTTTPSTTLHYTRLQPQLQLRLQLQLQLPLHHNYNYNYNCKYIGVRYTTLYPAVVGEVTAATTPKITTTFWSINGFALPSMHHNNAPLL